MTVSDSPQGRDKCGRAGISPELALRIADDARQAGAFVWPLPRM
jgi:hypothetical protein